MFGNKLLRSTFRPFVMRSPKISTLHRIAYHCDRVSKCKMGEECSTQSAVRKFEEISDGTPSRLEDDIKVEQINTGRFIMFSLITNIYNKKSK